MRKILCLLIGLCAATPALAETPTPQQQIESLIGNLIVANTSAQYQLNQAQQQIADLRKQLDDTKKPASNPAPADK